MRHRASPCCTNLTTERRSAVVGDPRFPKARHSRQTYSPYRFLWQCRRVTWAPQQTHCRVAPRRDVFRYPVAWSLGPPSADGVGPFLPNATTGPTEAVAESILPTGLVSCPGSPRGTGSVGSVGFIPDLIVDWPEFKTQSRSNKHC
jgi:hypothetical protein